MSGTTKHHAHLVYLQCWYMVFGVQTAAQA